MSASSPSQDETETTWGYAVAGAIALSAAGLIQFGLGELDADARANLPAFLAAPDAAAGKPGLTIPLVLLGLGLVARDALRGRGRPTEVKPTEPAPRALSRLPVRRPAREGEELETGEPIPEERSGGPPAAAKIPAMRGRFSDCPAGGGNNDGMVLASAKYLKRKPERRNFRNSPSVF